MIIGLLVNKESPTLSSISLSLTPGRTTLYQYVITSSLVRFANILEEDKLEYR